MWRDYNLYCVELSVAVNKNFGRGQALPHCREKRNRAVVCEGSPAVPRFLKIGVTIARFQASGNIEGQMIGAHSRRTRLVMRGPGCAVALGMGRCCRVR